MLTPFKLQTFLKACSHFCYLVFCGFKGQLAAATSCFCHNYEDADPFLSTETNWKHFGLELFTMDDQDCETEI